MDGDDEKWEDGEHPARIYGAGDLQLAYIETDHVIVARCLVWPEKLLMSRCYGDKTLMDSELKKLGYVTFDMGGPKYGFRGARLLKQKNSDGYDLMPYIDGPIQGFNDCGDHYKIGSDRTASSQCGHVLEEVTIELYPRGEVFFGCQEEADESEEIFYLEQYHSYVLRDECVIVNYEYYHVSDCVRLYDGDWALTKDAVQLHNGDWALTDDAVELHNGDWALTYDAVELHNGDWALTDDAVELHNGDLALTKDAVQLHNGDYVLTEDAVQLHNGDLALALCEKTLDMFGTIA
jgi:hypothetical protein